MNHLTLDPKLENFIRNEVASGRYGSQNEVIRAAVRLLRDESADEKCSRQPDPVIEFYKKDIDVTLLRENLKLTPAERIRKLTELAKFAEDLRLAGREAKKPHD